MVAKAEVKVVAGQWDVLGPGQEKRGKGGRLGKLVNLKSVKVKARSKTIT